MNLFELNFQGATVRPIVPKRKNLVVFIVHCKVLFRANASEILIFGIYSYQVIVKAEIKGKSVEDKYKIQATCLLIKQSESDFLANDYYPSQSHFLSLSLSFQENFMREYNYQFVTGLVTVLVVLCDGVELFIRSLI